MPPKIDYGKCDGCGICIFVCGKYVFSVRASDHKVIPKKAKECVNCFMCQDSCRIGAIAIKA
jgi:NAD-dependent dihydropyrimidine dehydrogenase PreA subunit